jgi:hypothetical protein
MRKRGAPAPPGRDQPGGRTEEAAASAAEQHPRGEAIPAVHEHIGRQLREMFEEVAAQPIPDKLRQLLEELERKQKKP